MKNTNLHKQPGKIVTTGKQRSYNEVVEYLDSHWSTNLNDTNLQCMKALDKAFGNISQQVNTILVTGSNGKSLTLNFATKLLRNEGLSVGTFYTPHILTYNERFAVNNETILNKNFTDIANEVINTVETLGLQANSYEILTIMALLYFKNNDVDVALLEVDKIGSSDATNICNPKIAAITRITTNEGPHASKEYIEQVLSVVKPGSHVVSADQSKLNLQIIQDLVTEKKGEWSMPIRKLAPLNYPFEQLHGRCAALAERVSYMYINTFANKDEMVADNSLLTKKKGQRGRPTLEAKRQAEKNPKKTIEQFWKDTENTLAGRFQLLDKEKPTLLLDNACNLDAFNNLLLGVRLLHYQRPFKGLTLILGGNNSDIDMPELLKLLRYFFKKTSGQIIVCPVEAVPGQKGAQSWNVEQLLNDLKGMKIKAKSSNSFKEAFDAAAKSVDDRNGLVVITGSSAVVSEYWKYKGIKKI